MARISLTGSFVLIPEGPHIFRIYGVEYDEDFGNLTVYMINAQGITHRENFHLKGAGDEPNAGAMNAFSFFAKTALNDYSLDDIDPADLVGHYIGAEVIHNKVDSKKPGQEGKKLTFANLGDKWIAEGFDTDPVPQALTKTLDDKDRPKSRREKKASAAPAPAPSVPAQTAQPLNLDALLG